MNGALDRGTIPRMAQTETPETTPAGDADAASSAVAAVLDSHAEKIAELGGRIDELEAELTRVGSAVNANADRGKPAADGATPASTAANEQGLQPGHAGLGTGDGPAGLR